VVLDLEMVLAVGLVTMLALERQEIDELAGLFRTLFSNCEQLCFLLWNGGCAGGGGSHGSGGKRKEKRQGFINAHDDASVLLELNELSQGVIRGMFSQLRVRC
jgi:hypothetical protein